jgi:hypothetical protein
MTIREAIFTILADHRKIKRDYNHFCSKHRRYHRWTFKWSRNPFLLWIEENWFGCDIKEDLVNFAYTLLIEDMRLRLKRASNCLTKDYIDIRQ